MRFQGICIEITRVEAFARDLADLHTTRGIFSTYFVIRNCTVFSWHKHLFSNIPLKVFIDTEDVC